ncbi:hypothetical protein, partial [Salmonella enterica]
MSITTALSGDVFDGVQIAMLLQSIDINHKCLQINPNGRQLLIIDKSACQICARAKPDRGLFAGYFKSLPEELNLRSRHFQFFTSFGHLMRSISMDAYTVPLICSLSNDDYIVLYQKTVH